MNGSRRHASSSVGAIADPRPRIGGRCPRVSARCKERRHAHRMRLRCCPGVRRRDHRAARSVVGSSDPSSAPRSEVATDRRCNVSQFVPPRRVRRLECRRRRIVDVARRRLVRPGGCLCRMEGAGGSERDLRRRSKRDSTDASERRRPGPHRMHEARPRQFLCPGARGIDANWRAPGCPRLALFRDRVIHRLWIDDDPGLPITLPGAGASPVLRRLSRVPTCGHRTRG